MLSSSTARHESAKIGFVNNAKKAKAIKAILITHSEWCTVLTPNYLSFNGGTHKGSVNRKHTTHCLLVQFLAADPVLLHLCKRLFQFLLVLDCFTPVTAFEASIMASFNIRPHVPVR